MTRGTKKKFLQRGDQKYQKSYDVVRKQPFIQICFGFHENSKLFEGFIELKSKISCWSIFVTFKIFKS